MKTVVIVGGGFSGTMAAVNLARLATTPLRVVLINRGHPLGRGVAYGTAREEHLLNVAARNMSAVPDHPEHFLDWLRSRVDYSDLPEEQLRETFVPRRVYGDYVRGLLTSYMKPIDEHHRVTIEALEDEVVDVAVQESGAAEVLLDSGVTVAADRVLLATGNQPPQPFVVDGEPFEHTAYCADPWSDWSARLPSVDEKVVILGSGLTMIDSLLTLDALGWKGQTVVISRNGMIPQAHFRGIAYPEFLPPEPDSVGLAALVGLLETHCRQLQRIGENPGILVDRMRPHTQRIWQRLNLDEKREFLSRYAARWNVIRHRIAQPIHQRVTEAITEGRVRVIKGSVTELSDSNREVLVMYEDPDGRPRSLDGGLVLNCTGPNAGFSESHVPLFQNLMNRGLIRPDQLDMGIDVGADFSVIDAEGNSSSILFAIGPLMKGTLWETTAVPELRGQAMRVAQLLLEQVHDAAADRDYRMSVEEEHVIEYYI